MNKILIIQDCQGSSCEKLLPQDCDFQVLQREQLFLAKYKNSDLIILDESLTHEKRIVCQRLRSDGIGQPIIVFSDQSDSCEKAGILNDGADDVVTKHIDPNEFKARVNSLLRRPPAFFQDKVRIDNLIIDINKRVVFRAKKKITLTKTEFRLLFALVQGRGVAMSRDHLFERVWSFDSDQYITIVDVYIRFLRKKIDDGFKKKLINTVRGVGYCIEG